MRRTAVCVQLLATAVPPETVTSFAASASAVVSVARRTVRLNATAPSTATARLAELDVACDGLVAALAEDACGKSPAVFGGATKVSAPVTPPTRAMAQIRRRTFPAAAILLRLLAINYRRDSGEPRR
mmetsp:Transcript_30948/g.69633  ORF Transcript_30948/g.69633 Transcript_30948/m.69633 type:complete len:127 (+) Transcript_30948:860-1240(+)